MRKLYKLKRWYSLDDAAKRLTLTLGEPIDPQDLRQLMADGHISAHCNVESVYAIEVAPASLFHGPDSELVQLHRAYGALQNELDDIAKLITLGFCEQTDIAESLDGTFKIEAIDAKWITSKYWLRAIANGTELEYLNDDDVGGNVMLSGEDGKLWQLVSKYDRQKKHVPWNNARNFYPTGSLPHATEIVISKTEIERFESQFLEPTMSEKPLSTTERNTLLVIIAALCAKAGINHGDPKAASQIERLIALVGNGASVTDETIRKHLQKISSALAARGG